MKQESLTPAHHKYTLLQEILRGLGPVAIAFSGGVDSTFLLHAASAVLGDRVVAYHARTTLQTVDEQERALSHAGLIGCDLEYLDVDPLTWPEFVANPPDRCYLCKKRLYSRFLKAARKDGGRKLIDGTNLDDLSDDRPGLRALAELGVRTPLSEAGLTKKEIRELGREMGLPNWNQPSSSCLATRIVTGRSIRKKDLRVVAECESFLQNLGFAGCRVRLRPDFLTIEVTEEDFSLFISPAIRAGIASFCRKKGFSQVFVSLEAR